MSEEQIGCDLQGLSAGHRQHKSKIIPPELRCPSKTLTERLSILSKFINFSRPAPAGRPPNDEQARRRVDFAREHLWSRRPETLLGWLANASDNDRYSLNSPYRYRIGDILFLNFFPGGIHIRFMR
jgi:hypothetical protein